MIKKYLIVARSSVNGSLVPDDVFNDTREKALEDIDVYHQEGLNGDAGWPIHSIIEIEIGEPLPSLTQRSLSPASGS